MKDAAEICIYWDKQCYEIFSDGFIDIVVFIVSNAFSTRISFLHSRFICGEGQDTTVFDTTPNLYGLGRIV